MAVKGQEGNGSMGQGIKDRPMNPKHSRLKIYICQGHGSKVKVRVPGSRSRFQGLGQGSRVEVKVQGSRSRFKGQFQDMHLSRTWFKGQGPWFKGQGQGSTSPQIKQRSTHES